MRKHPRLLRMLVSWGYPLGRCPANWGVVGVLGLGGFKGHASIGSNCLVELKRPEGRLRLRVTFLDEGHRGGREGWGVVKVYSNPDAMLQMFARVQAEGGRP